MKKIKFLPGLLSYLHFFEPLTYVLAIINYVAGGYFSATLAVTLLSFFMCRLFFVFLCNGAYLFIFNKNKKLYVFRDLFFYNRYFINEKTIVYKTKLLGFSHIRGPGYIARNALTIVPTVEKDGCEREDAFVIFKEGNLKENGINHIFDEQDRLIVCRENLFITDKLRKNKNIIILNGNKSNYNFLRQFVEKEQFCGVTNTDKLHLEDLEKSFQESKGKSNKR